MLFKDKKDNNKKDKNKILILILFVIIDYYSTEWYKKIPCRILFLNRNI